MLIALEQRGNKTFWIKACIVVHNIRDARVVVPECEEKELDRAAFTSCALDSFVEKKNRQAVAYYYEGSPAGEHENIVTSVIAGNTLLTAHHVPVPENAK
jgi:hypothetical protein